MNFKHILIPSLIPTTIVFIGLLMIIRNEEKISNSNSNSIYPIKIDTIIYKQLLDSIKTIEFNVNKLSKNNEKLDSIYKRQTNSLKYINNEMENLKNSIGKLSDDGLDSIIFSIH